MNETDDVLLLILSVFVGEDGVILGVNSLENELEEIKRFLGYWWFHEKRVQIFRLVQLHTLRNLKECAQGFVKEVVGHFFINFNEREPVSLFAILKFFGELSHEQFWGQLFGFELETPQLNGDKNNCLNK